MGSKKQERCENIPNELRIQNEFEPLHEWEPIF